MTDGINKAPFAISLAGGSQLATGERAIDIDPDHPDNKANIDAGHLLIVEPVALEDLKVPELRKIAESLGVTHKDLKRDDLLAAIEAAKSNQEVSS